jgi:hypothetical protein
LLLSPPQRRPHRGHSRCFRQYSSSSSSTSEKSKGPINLSRSVRGQKSKQTAPHMTNYDHRNNQIYNNTKNSSTNTDTFINHIINGGTPDDPSPPPFQLANFGEDSLYTLVLLRHGESEWNMQNRYTGWCDVNLTPKGKKEARDAGRLLCENGCVRWTKT